MRFFLFIISVLFLNPSINSFAQTGSYIIPGVTSESISDLNQGTANFYWLAGNNGLVMKSSDQGKSWSELTTGTNHNLKKMFKPASNQIWVAGDSGIVIVSIDTGTTWELKAPGITANFISIFSRGSGVAYVIGDSGSCYYSVDLGSNWTTRTVPTNENLNDGLGPVSGTSLVAVVGGTNGVIFKTTDAGVNWSSIPSGTTEDINGFSFGPSGVLFAACTNGIILNSTDSGDSWSVIATSTSQDLLSIDASGQNTNWLIACGSGGTLLKSTDIGVNWFFQASPTTENLLCAYAVSNSIHFAGGVGGILLKTTDGGGDPVNMENESEFPKKFILEPNYPNPFNPSTTIKYSIPRESFVTIKVYNLIGEEAATLINDKHAIGNYEVEFNASTLASGIYLYTIQAGSFTETKKMILLK